MRKQDEQIPTVNPRRIGLKAAEGPFSYEDMQRSMNEIRRKRWWKRRQQLWYCWPIAVIFGVGACYSLLQGNIALGIVYGIATIAFIFMWFHA